MSSRSARTEASNGTTDHCAYGCPRDNHDPKGICMHDCERCPNDAPWCAERKSNA
jgi:hypothetical protein